MFYGSEEDRHKGNEAEDRFTDWLDKHIIPYLYIKQDTETFSTAFRDSAGKRPDFLILIPHFGFIFVDVKYKNLNSEYNTYPIDADETKKYSSLQRKFNMQVWYVLSNEKIGYKTWMWIPVSKVMEHDLVKRESSISKQHFFAVPSDSFIQLAEDDSLERLCSKLFKK